MTMRFTVIIDVEEPEALENRLEYLDDDERQEEQDSWQQDIADGLTSVDMEAAVRECLEAWYRGTGSVIIQHCTPTLRKWRVQVELHGKPARFYVSADTKDAAKAKVQEQLGAGGDWAFTRTYELPFWQEV